MVGFESKGEEAMLAHDIKRQSTNQFLKRKRAYARLVKARVAGIAESELDRRLGKVEHALDALLGAVEAVLDRRLWIVDDRRHDAVAKREMILDETTAQQDTCDRDCLAEAPALRM
jgi:hypothetical protein